MEELYAHILKRDSASRVDVLCYNTSGALHKENYKKMTIYRIACLEILPGQFAIPHPIELITILLRLSKTPYEIVHANTRFFESAWWAWIYARIIGAKAILTDHVANHPIHPNNTVSQIARFFDVTITRWVVHQYDLITATNKKTQEFLLSRLKAKYVTLLYGGVDTKFYKPMKSTILRKLPKIAKQFSQRDIIITFSGRLIETKGVMLFMQAISQLIHFLPKHIYFVIAGSGTLSKQINIMRSRRPLNTRIFTTGALEGKDVAILLRRSDIFVHPSYHAEGFPNAILEAGASGCFVIATDNAGTSEIIENKTTGLLMKQKNVAAMKKAILWAITHPNERIKMAKRARQLIVKRFDWRERATEFTTLAEQLYLKPNSLQNPQNDISLAPQT